MENIIVTVCGTFKNVGNMAHVLKIIYKLNKITSFHSNRVIYLCYYSKNLRLVRRNVFECFPHC